MNRRGPSIEPWGTPRDRGAVEEVQLLMLMNCCEIRLPPGAGSTSDVEEGGWKVREGLLEDCFCAVWCVKSRSNRFKKINHEVGFDLDRKGRLEFL